MEGGGENTSYEPIYPHMSQVVSDFADAFAKA